MKETKKYLRNLNANGKPVQPVVIELQRNILTLMGYDATYACNCLNEISAKYADDEDLMTKMQQFAMCAQVSAS